MPILKLLCEYEDRPINVQIQRPRFCWALDDNTVREQLSYRIIVSEDKGQRNRPEPRLFRRRL